MIDEIKSLSMPYFLDGTLQIDVSQWIDASVSVRLDLEKLPPLLYMEGDRLEISVASDDQLLDILNGLRNLPLLRPRMYKYEIHALFTNQEKAIIRSIAPDFVELLLMADEPVSTSKVIPFLTQLYENKIISFERFYQLTGIR